MRCNSPPKELFEDGEADLVDKDCNDDVICGQPVTLAVSDNTCLVSVHQPISFRLNHFDKIFKDHQAPKLNSLKSLIGL